MNSRSPLTEHVQSFQARPRAARCAAGAGRSARRRRRPRRRSSVSGWSPSDRGHHSRGSSMSRFQLTSLRPAASGARARPRPRRRPSVRSAHGARAVAVEPGRTAAGGPATSSASRHSTRKRSMRTGPVSYTCTGRHSPPGFQSRSMPSQCWNTPGDGAPSAVPALRRARHLDRPRTCSSPMPRQRRDVERVREEVALRVAEVGAVEPDVGLVEDAVERHPAAAALRRRGQLEALAVEQRAVAVGELGMVAPVAGHGDLGPRRVVDVEPDRVAAQVVVGRRCAPHPVSSTPASVPGRSRRRRAAVPRYGRDRFGPCAELATTLGELRASGWKSRPVKEEIRANAVERIAAGEPLFDGRARLRAHRDAAARERAARRARRDLPRRARPGQDAHDPLAHRPARRVDADRRRQRDQRRSVPPGRRSTPATWSPSSATTRRSMGAPRRPLRREAGHARHVDRRPDRRGRPDQGRRGPLPVRRAHAALRAGAAHQPRHLRHQRAPRPRRADPGRPAQRARGARRPDPRLQDPPAARRDARRLGQPGGLHQPRPHHHAAEGPLRQPDPHALPARRRHRVRRSCARRRGPLVGGRDGRAVTCPTTSAEVVATISQLARASSHVNQRSGVSVRLSASPTTRRSPPTRCGAACAPASASVVARVDDLEALAASSIGKIEIESLDEGREGAIFENLVKGAVLTVFKERVAPDQIRDVIVDAFEEGVVVHTGEDIASDRPGRARRAGAGAARARCAALTGGDESPAAVAAAVEFVLEGLHLSKRLNKDASGGRATYRGRVTLAGRLCRAPRHASGVCTTAECPRRSADELEPATGRRRLRVAAVRSPSTRRGGARRALGRSAPDGRASPTLPGPVGDDRGRRSPAATARATSTGDVGDRASDRPESRLTAGGAARGLSSATIRCSVAEVAPAQRSAIRCVDASVGPVGIGSSGDTRTEIVHDRCATRRARSRPTGSRERPRLRVVRPADHVHASRQASAAVSARRSSGDPSGRTDVAELVGDRARPDRGHQLPAATASVKPPLVVEPARDRAVVQRRPRARSPRPPTPVVEHVDRTTRPSSSPRGRPVRRGLEPPPSRAGSRTASDRRARRAASRSSAHRVRTGRRPSTPTRRRWSRASTQWQTPPGRPRRSQRCGGDWQLRRTGCGSRARRCRCGRARSGCR